MKKKIFYYSLIALVFSQCCKDKNDESIKYSNSLSAEMMGYFVNYQIGTKWIYQDTLNPSSFDTIELISKESYDINNGNGNKSQGFVLYYKPQKSKDFKVFVTAGVNNSYYVKVDPLVTAAGKIVFENNNGKWTTGVSFYDSLELNKKMFYNIIQSNSNNSFHQLMSISKEGGICSFWKIKGPGVLESFYVLTKMIKP